jgi:DNA processing protein
VTADHSHDAGRRVDAAGDLPDEAYAVALLQLPELWPSRLAWLLGRTRRVEDKLFDLDPPLRTARATWNAVLDRRLPGRATSVKVMRIAARWPGAAATVDVATLWARYIAAGVEVDIIGDAGYPPELAADREAPVVVFRTGAAPDLSGRRVAIVGTRHPSAEGRDIAHELGRDLAAAGVRVVSGLALGIDGAAHTGALAAGRGAPIGVVASGLDAPYPARHRLLWADVAATGVLVSEAPLGARSEPWRFPARNRIIAALAEIVVVVESKERGGSMITADLAVSRGTTVMAVPGSVRNPLSAGTNQLLSEGAGPVRNAHDVFDALALEIPPMPSPPPMHLDETAAAVLAAVGWQPTPTDQIVAGTRLDPAVVAAALARLEMEGLLAGSAGRWRRSGRLPTVAAPRRYLSRLD